ncbi:transmembrane protein [Erwinia phage Gungnir39]|nr:transmembrane protein [Erwinia phage Gungnir39]
MSIAFNTMHFLAVMMFFFADITQMKSFAIFGMMFILLSATIVYSRIKGWL